MSEPGTGEHSARSLAEILREHGMETEQGTRPGRRNPFTARRENAATGAHTAERPVVVAEAPQQPAAVVPQREEPVRRTAPDARDLARMLREHGLESEYGTRPDRPQPRLGTPEPQPRRVTTDPQDLARMLREHGLESEHGTRPDRPQPRQAVDRRTGERRTGERRTDRPAAELFAAPPAPAATGATAGPGDRREGTGRVEDRPAHPVTGRIPIARPEGATAATGTSGARPEPAPAPEEPLTGRQGVLAWARFAGEMVVALAGGVGVYFAFTALWQLMPYLAVVAAPLVVTALVAGAQAWRQRQGGGALGVRLLAVLLFAATVLVVAPAAGLLSG